MHFARSQIRSGVSGAAASALLAAAFAAASPTGHTGRLLVRVVDAYTRQPLPARLALRTSDRRYPGDRIDGSADRWPNLEMHGVFVNGAQVFEVPPGQTEITAAHGLEYRAESRTVQAGAEGITEVEIPLKRVFDMAAAGWVSGDLHVHMLHGENQRKTSYADVAATCAANGLDFVSVGQEYVGAGQLDLAGYQAECRNVSTERFKMLLGAERPKNLLGHQVMLGAPNPFLISEDPPYYRSAEKVHAGGGVLAYVHPVRYFPQKQYEGKWLDFPGNNLARELVMDAFLGPSFDALSVLSDEPDNREAFGLWFTLLNRGLFVPAMADSDACFDRPTLGMKTPGLWSTYFYVGPGQAVDAAHLTRAVREGRTLATTGPLLQFKVDGRISGSTLSPDGRPHRVRIDAYLPQHAFTLARANAKSGRTEGISRIELIRSGKVVRTWEPHAAEAHVDCAVTETEPCWYVARVYGEDAKWQVGVASPIYFAAQPAAGKRAPLSILVRGRIYDFTTGREETGTVEVVRGDRVLKTFPAEGQFRVKMPLDADLVVRRPGARPERRRLLTDYGPVHHFLWGLTGSDLAKPETFDRFERLVRSVDLEFPIGFRLPGSYLTGIAGAAAEKLDFGSLRIVDGPKPGAGGTAAVAAVLMDAEQVSPGTSFRVAAIYHDEGDPTSLGPLVVEARGYDPAHPTAYGALKKFSEFEKRWNTAVDLGNGCRLVQGVLTVPTWVEPGPTGGIDLSIRARKGDSDASFLGMHIPLGPALRALSVTTAWPTMPLSWPDGHYGIGPFTLCNRAGREARPRADYRSLHLQVRAGGRTIDLFPARDARGCPDADDAVYADQFLDQVLNDETHLVTPPAIRAQPGVRWRENAPVIDATGPGGGPR